jgi:hypothetical protein
MNRRVAFVGLSIAFATSHAYGQQPPVASATSHRSTIATAIPGLRVEWAITPTAIALDPRYPTLSTAPPRVGPNVGSPVGPVSVTLVLRMENTTGTAIHVGSAHGEFGAPRLTLTGPGATSIASRSMCQGVARTDGPPQWIEVPPHRTAYLLFAGLADSSICPHSSWFWTSAGHYVVHGALRTYYTVGAPPAGTVSGTAVDLEIPPLSIEVTR